MKNFICSKKRENFPEEREIKRNSYRCDGTENDWEMEFLLKYNGRNLVFFNEYKLTHTYILGMWKVRTGKIEL